MRASKPPLKLPPIQTLLPDLSQQSHSPEVRAEPESSAAAGSHGSWRDSEDELLRNAVSTHGDSQWDSIALAVPGRTPTQCRERWVFRISPGLNKNPFERWEDELIVRERNRVGNHWTLIADQLPGRTSCAVKNRWYSSLRRNARQIEERDDQRRPRQNHGDGIG
jgi:hypothetical protein